MRDREIAVNVATVSRRRFAGSVVAAAATTLLPAAAGESDKVRDSDGDLGFRPVGLSVADWDEVHARYANVIPVYGERLSAEESAG
jgi:hypothetical protein